MMVGGWLPDGRLLSDFWVIMASLAVQLVFFVACGALIRQSRRLGPRTPLRRWFVTTNIMLLILNLGQFLAELALLGYFFRWAHEPVLDRIYGTAVAFGWTGACLVGTSFFVTCLHAVGADEVLSRWWVRAVVALPASCLILLVATNSWHHLFYLDMTTTANVYGPWFYGVLASVYLLVLSGSVVLLVDALRSRAHTGVRVCIILVATVLPLLANSIRTVVVARVPDFLPLGFLASFALFAVLIIRFRFAGLRPIAMQAAVDASPSPVWVFDDAHELTYRNARARELRPAAERLLCGAPWADSVRSAEVEVGGRVWQVALTSDAEQFSTVVAARDISGLASVRATLAARERTLKHANEFLALQIDELTLLTEAIATQAHVRERAVLQAVLRAEVRDDLAALSRRLAAIEKTTVAAGDRACGEEPRALPEYAAAANAAYAILERVRATARTLREGPVEARR